MIGVDTNVLLRFLLTEDASQHELASSFMQQRTRRDPAFISLVVLCELVWVLRRVQRIPQSEIESVIAGLLLLDNIRIEDADFLRSLLSAEEPRADLADHLISRLAERAGCRSTATFDRKAVRLVLGMTLLA